MPTYFPPTHPQHVAFFITEQPSTGLANPYEGACPNCLQISKKSFCVPMGNLKSKLVSYIIIINYCITITIINVCYNYTV